MLVTLAIFSTLLIGAAPANAGMVENIDCYTGAYGLDYDGELRTTVDGAACSSRNKCHGTKGYKPWCYTSGSKWGYCDVPKCSDDQTSYPTTAAPTTATPGCFEQDVAYPGNDIGSYVVLNSPEACQIECANTAGCIVWTYNPADVHQMGSSNACYLKHTRGTPISKPGKTSGHKNCPTLEETCYDTDTDYLGNDIALATDAAQQGITTAQQCQAKCQATTDCTFFTFYDQAGAQYGCYLKNAKSTPSRKMKCISGPKYCDRSVTAGPTTAAPTTAAPTTAAPTTVAPTTKAPVSGLALGVRCNSKSPPCAEPNSACITYRCKCVDEWVRYPRNGDTCVAQNRLELLTPCTTPRSPCSAFNSECRAYRCFCKSGFTISQSGLECE